MTAEQIPSPSVDQQVDGLIRGPQYAMRQAEKDVLLTSLLRVLCREMAERCPPYGRFLQRLGSKPDTWQTPADIPPLPATMFKRFLLSAVPPEKVVRQLYSSSTSGEQPSRIVLDKTTAFRQTRAMPDAPRPPVSRSPARTSVTCSPKVSSR